VTDSSGSDDGAGVLSVATIHEDAAGDEYDNLNDEYVVFENTGDAALDLSGWTVSDEADHTYTFPEGVTLDAGAQVTLRTGSGTDDETDLYWGSKPRSGTTAATRSSSRTTTGRPYSRRNTDAIKWNLRRSWTDSRRTWQCCCWKRTGRRSVKFRRRRGSVASRRPPRRRDAGGRTRRRRSGRRDVRGSGDRRPVRNGPRAGSTACHSGRRRKTTRRIRPEVHWHSLFSAATLDRTIARPDALTITTAFGRTNI